MLKELVYVTIIGLALTSVAAAQTVTITSATRNSANGPIDVKLTLTGTVTLEAFEFKDSNGNNLNDDFTCQGGGSQGGTVQLNYTITNPPPGAERIRVRFNVNNRSAVWVVIVLPVW